MQTRFISKANLRGLVAAMAVVSVGGAAFAQATAPAAPPPVSDLVRKQA